MFKDNIFIEESEKLINSSMLTSNDVVENNIKVSEILVDAKMAKSIGRNRGKYITISFDRDNVTNNLEKLIDFISSSFSNLIKYLKLSGKIKVLFIGLGNKDITSDKFGYLCTEKIAVGENSYKLYKNVQGITNINSVDFTRHMAQMLEVDLVIVFDSLKAEHLTRLGNTIQLSTGGIYPGSALSEKKSELSKRTIKTNVISVGVPTIINMKNIGKDNPNVIVSTKDIDRVVDDLSSVISIAVNRLF